MPKLAMIVICDKVLFDRASNLPSLITLFTRVSAEVTPETPLPENAVSPLRWSIFTKWDCTGEELNTAFRQKTEVVSPNGSIYASVETPFSIVDMNDLSSRNATEIFGVPVSQPGFLEVRTWIEGFPEAKGDCRILVSHTSKPDPVT